MTTNIVFGCDRCGTEVRLDGIRPPDSWWELSPTWAAVRPAPVGGSIPKFLLCAPCKDAAFHPEPKVELLRERLRRALDTLDLARGSLGIDQTATVKAIDRCLEENKALFCEGLSLSPKGAL